MILIIDEAQENIMVTPRSSRPPPLLSLTDFITSRNTKLSSIHSQTIDGLKVAVIDL